MEGLSTVRPHEFDAAAAAAAAAFSDALAFLSRSLANVVALLPELEARQRGGELLHRFPEKSVTVALGLKLVQLTGHVRAGELLIRNGFLFEWDVIQRTLQDGTEDVTFLVVAEGRGETKLLRRYLEFFFDEDIGRDGALGDRPAVSVERREIRRAIEEKARELGAKDTGKVMKGQSRVLHRLRSGSVHGRGASIVRAYFDESAAEGLWLGAGRREARRAAWELPTLYMATSNVVSAFGVAGAGRWWGEDYLLEVTERVDRLQESASRMVRALKVCT